MVIDLDVRRNAPELAGTDTSLRAGQRIDLQPLPFSGLSSTGTRHELLTPQHSRTNLGHGAVRAGPGRGIFAGATGCRCSDAAAGIRMADQRGDLYNRNFSPLDQVNTDNVGRLGPVWRTHLNGSGLEAKYSGEAQPLIIDGIMYVITGADDVFALSVETGEMLWSNEAQLSSEISTICCGWTSRGVGYGEDKIFVGQLDGVLKALDAETGEQVWSIQAESWEEGYTITSAPLYFDGMVISGFAGAEFVARGRVKAYDAADGSLLWTFYTVPAPGELGSDTWPADSDAWETGGGTVWHTPAVDPELGLIYLDR